MVRRNSNINLQATLDNVNALVAQANASALSASAISQNIATNRTKSQPEISYDFANANTSEQIDLFFTRNSIATFFNRSGTMKTAQAGKSRVIHNPNTLECEGLRIEPTRTNLLTYSNSFTDLNSVKTACSVVVSTTEKKNPDGSFLSKLIEDSSNGSHYLDKQLLSVTAGNTYTGSFYVKKSERNKVGISFGNTVIWGGTNPFAIFDLDTLSLVTSTNVLGYEIKQVGDFVRISITQVCTVSGQCSLRANLINSAGAGAYQGDGVSGLYIFGFQFEFYYASSYIPTDSAQVTRASEGVNIPIDAKYSDITVFFSGFKAKTTNTYLKYLRVGTDLGYVSISENSTGNKIFAELQENGVSKLPANFISSASIAQDSKFRACLALSRNDSKFFVNDFASPSSIVDFNSIVQKIEFSSDNSIIVSSVLIFFRRLSDSECSALCNETNLVGSEKNKLSTNNQLKGCAFLDVNDIKKLNVKQEIPIDGTGSSFTRIVRRTYKFYFNIVESTGSSISAQPPIICEANTDYNLTFNAPLGRTLLYSVTPF